MNYDAHVKSFALLNWRHAAAHAMVRMIDARPDLDWYSYRPVLDRIRYLLHNVTEPMPVDDWVAVALDAILEGQP